MNILDELVVIFNRLELYEEFRVLGEEWRIEILYSQGLNVRCFRAISNNLERVLP